MNSWPEVVRTLLPHAEELHSLYAAMALLVCLGAATTASSATAARPSRSSCSTICTCSSSSARRPRMRSCSREPCAPPSCTLCGGGVLTGAWLLSLCAVNAAVAFATLVASLCAMRRLHLAVLTLRANRKPSLVLPRVGRPRIL